MARVGASDADGEHFDTWVFTVRAEEARHRSFALAAELPADHDGQSVV
jgi:hypothetical protein